MLVLCYFYIICIFIILHCPLSRPDLIYIPLLIIPCIIYYVMNKETLNLKLGRDQLEHLASPLTKSETSPSPNTNESKTSPRR